MSKCEWKDGKFYPCDGFNPVFMRHTSGMLPYCYYCGTEYPRPEPSVIIKKSGGTWVARHNNVDYICFVPHAVPCAGDGITSTWSFLYDGVVPSYWEKIAEIRITDEIAKLRPMVVCENGDDDIKMLVYASEKLIIVTDDSYDYHASNIRLATVDDLA